MIDSPRKVIRRAVAARLKTPTNGEYPTPCQDRVFASRALDLPREALPAICVYTLGADPGEDLDLDGAVIEQTLRLAVEVHAAGDDVADLVDDISWRVERIITDELTIPDDNPEIRKATWEGWSLAQDVSGELIDGLAASSFAIDFVWRKPEADYNLSDFRRIHGAMTPIPDGDQPAEEFRAEMEV